ncbi:uncharacterized protein PFL1_05132 [Pseudozyma flocculosa PF-1]|uniref:Methylated-DNA-[protein]-cysteine S-methyltransferase DNA binding domain-containing protein n=1 Tax=Pseudozyma flocculosa PF-1 TaxID=1277687 RepID=A0A061H485_9BASI|nr:uncharacterized protein PFL1_05132 [Pseudozyma flocculosa PF-1]EPQ27209.1 hypothetical protein PFL1_05132 [Pseudozyma flocculosa PF-1]
MANGSINPEIFHAKVYEICRLIPYGRVTTYDSRLVGSALKFLGDPSVPWQRVIASSGAISDRGDGGEAAARQAQRLRQEGVAVSEGRGGGVSTHLAGHANPNAKWRVSLAEFGWFPDQVHLEGFDDDDDDDEASRARNGDDDESDLSSLSELED